MKRTVEISLYIIIAIVLLAGGYMATVILKARSTTANVVNEALHSPNVYLKAADLSERQKKILLDVEDPSFYKHDGVDLETPGQGANTITQNLVKQFYFKNYLGGVAKIKQGLIAKFVMTPTVTKDEQLTLFITYAYLGKVDGKDVWGFTNAAIAYYHKKFTELTEKEYTSIVAMLIAPHKYSILTHPADNAKRVARIEKLLSGEYKPKGRMDVYYGPLSAEEQEGLPPGSYHADLYE